MLQVFIKYSIKSSICTKAIMALKTNWIIELHCIVCFIMFGSSNIPKITLTYTLFTVVEHPSVKVNPAGGPL